MITRLVSAFLLISAATLPKHAAARASSPAGDICQADGGGGTASTHVEPPLPEPPLPSGSDVVESDGSAAAGAAGAVEVNATKETIPASGFGGLKPTVPTPEQYNEYLSNGFIRVMKRDPDQLFLYAIHYSLDKSSTTEAKLKTNFSFENFKFKNTDFVIKGVMKLNAETGEYEETKFDSKRTAVSNLRRLKIGDFIIGDQMQTAPGADNVEVAYSDEDYRATEEESKAATEERAAKIKAAEEAKAAAEEAKAAKSEDEESRAKSEDEQSQRTRNLRTSMKADEESRAKSDEIRKGYFQLRKDLSDLEGMLEDIKSDQGGDSGTGLSGLLQELVDGCEDRLRCSNLNRFNYNIDLQERKRLVQAIVEQINESGIRNIIVPNYNINVSFAKVSRENCDLYVASISCSTFLCVGKYLHAIGDDLSEARFVDVEGFVFPQIFADFTGRKVADVIKMVITWDGIKIPVKPEKACKALSNFKIIVLAPEGVTSEVEKVAGAAQAAEVTARASPPNPNALSTGEKSSAAHAPAEDTCQADGGGGAASTAEDPNQHELVKDPDETEENYELRKGYFKLRKDLSDLERMLDDAKCDEAGDSGAGLSELLQQLVYKCEARSAKGDLHSYDEKDLQDHNRLVQAIVEQINESGLGNVIVPEYNINVSLVKVSREINC